MTGVLLRRGNLDTERAGVYMHSGMAMWGHSEKTDIHKPRRETSGENNPAVNLILDFQPPELSGNKILLLKLSSLCYFVIAAWAD